MPLFRKPASANSPPKILTLILLAGMAVTAMNVFLPVLPRIAAELNTTNAIAQYVLTLFLACTALAQLLIGPMADYFGRRPVLIFSLLIFLAGTIVCLFATNIETLLFGRALQAASAACMALSRAIVRDLYDRAKAASMIGYVTMAMALVPMVAPGIGGYLGEAMGWKGPFWFLLVVGISMLALVWFDLGETHFAEPRPVAHQVRDYFSLLREPEIWGYFLAASTASGAYFAFLGGAPFVAEQIIGLSPSAMGLWFGTVAIGYMAGNFLTGRFSERVGIENMMVIGGVIASIGVGISLYLMTSFPPHEYYLFLPMAAVGLGNGICLPNANAGAISVRPELAGSASGIGGFLQIGGGAILAVLSGSLITLENDAIPLYLIMFISSVACSILSLALLIYQRRAMRGNGLAEKV